MTRNASRRATFARLCLVVGLAAPLLVARATVAQDAPKVLRIHQASYPETADPQKSSFFEEIAFLVTNYEGLTRLDADGRVVPAAAERWEFSADATVLTFTLREGLTYSDGSPLTAERFRYAAERTCDPNTAGDYQYVLFDIVGCEEFAGLYAEDGATPAASPVAGDDAAYEAAKAGLGVEASDERTLVVRLKAPAPYFPAIAGLWVFFPAKQESIEAGGEGWWTDPANQVGNGPFQVTEMDQDQLVAFEANERYWGGRAKLDGLELVYVADPAVALEAYGAGDLDIMLPDPAQYPAIRADATLRDELLVVPGTNTDFLTFDLKQPPFDDVKVRQAFAYAFDRETWCADVLNGACTPAYSLIPAGVPGAIESDAYAYDPEAARQTLAESSYGGPENLPEIEYHYIADFPEERPRAEWIAGQFRDVLGVEISLVPVEVQTWVVSTSDPELYPQMTLLGWFQDYPDPQNWLSLLYSCAGLNATPAGYCNPEFDALVEQGDAEVDMATRLPFYEEAGRLLLEDAPMIVLDNRANVHLVKPFVTGYATSPADGAWPGEFSSPLTLDVNR